MPRHPHYLPHGVIPAVLLPFFDDLSIDEKSFRSQNQHEPQEIVKGTTTRSPGLSLVTPAPTSSTTPIGSWPMTSPAFIVGTNPS